MATLVLLQHSQEKSVRAHHTHIVQLAMSIHVITSVTAAKRWKHSDARDIANMQQVRRPARPSKHIWLHTIFYNCCQLTTTRAFLWTFGRLNGNSNEAATTKHIPLEALDTSKSQKLPWRKERPSHPKNAFQDSWLHQEHSLNKQCHW